MLLTHLFLLLADPWSQIDQNLCALRRNVPSSTIPGPIRSTMTALFQKVKRTFHEVAARLSCGHILGKTCFHKCLHKWYSLMCRQWVFNGERLMDTLLLAPVFIHTPGVLLADLLYDEGRFGKMKSVDILLGLRRMIVWSIYVLKCVFAWLAPSYHSLV